MDVDGIFTYNEAIKINHSCEYTEYTSVPWILYLPSLLSNLAKCFSVRKKKNVSGVVNLSLHPWSNSLSLNTSSKSPTQPFENHHFIIYPSLPTHMTKKKPHIPLPLTKLMFPRSTLVLPFISALSSLRSVSKSALSWVFWAIKAKSAWLHSHPRQVAGGKSGGDLGSGLFVFHWESHVFCCLWP